NYLAAVVKFAVAIAGFLLISEVFIDLMISFNKLLWVVIVLSIVVGNLLAIIQKDAKRVLAYSAIAHTAYFSIGFLEPTLEVFQQAFYAYLIFYTILSLITFTIMDVLENNQQEDVGVNLEELQGLIYRSPFLGTVLILALLSLAGLPPIFFALLAKVFVLKALLTAGYIGIACFIVLGTVLGCFYYFKMIALIVSRTTTEGETKVLELSTTKIMSLFILVGTLFYYTIYPSRIFDYLLRLI
ncbi:MAG: proton-conducting transporter membrane subunit, partial [Candidatus Paceibacterota bacterium]